MTQVDQEAALVQTRSKSKTSTSGDIFAKDDVKSKFSVPERWASLLIYLSKMSGGPVRWLSGGCPVGDVRWISRVASYRPTNSCRSTGLSLSERRTQLKLSWSPWSPPKLPIHSFHSFSLVYTVVVSRPLDSKTHFL
jgi:hypothetical protein